MISLFEELLIKICEELFDNEKISLTSTSSNTNKLKYKLIYRTRVDITKIRSLSYFDNFENIKIYGFLSVFPKNIKYIHYTTYTKYVEPKNVTHLTYAPDIRLTRYSIPLSVTHLKFGDHFNQPIKKCIPSFVTHLTFGHSFNKKITDDIPWSVTHLVFGNLFDKPIDNIPSSVTHLTVGKNFNQEIGNILSGITHLNLYPKISMRIHYKVPKCIAVTFG
jgi:hypothetical protein